MRSTEIGAVNCPVKDPMILDQRQSLANILKTEFDALQQKNPNFSGRAFAKRLGISSSALSELLSGKRSISEKKAMALLERLNIDPVKADQLKEAFNSERTFQKLKQRRNPRNETILASEDYDVFDWKCYCLLALISTCDFQNDPKWIARRLNLPVREVTKLITFLSKKNAVSIDDEGNIRDNRVTYRTPTDFPEELLAAKQKQAFETIAELMNEKNPYQFGGDVTISVDLKRLPEAKIMIEDFSRRLALFLSEGTNREEVFELHIHLFPRTRR